MSTATTPLARPRASRNLSKHLLWYALGLAGISVLYYTDYPLLHPSADPYRAKLIFDRFLLIPHAVAGILATALGPFQFSTRFRQRHLPLHRLMGKTSSSPTSPSTGANSPPATITHEDSQKML